LLPDRQKMGLPDRIVARIRNGPGECPEYADVVLLAEIRFGGAKIPVASVQLLVSGRWTSREEGVGTGTKTLRRGFAEAAYRLT